MTQVKSQKRSDICSLLRSHIFLSPAQTHIYNLNCNFSGLEGLFTFEHLRETKTKTKKLDEEHEVPLLGNLAAQGELSYKFLFLVNSPRGPHPHPYQEWLALGVLKHLGELLSLVLSCNLASSRSQPPKTNKPWRRRRRQLQHSCAPWRKSFLHTSQRAGNLAGAGTGLRREGKAEPKRQQQRPTS